MSKIADWLETPLGELIDQPKSGVSVLVEDRAPPPNSPGVLRLSCITGGRFNHKDAKVPLAGEVERLDTVAERNTILVSRSNTSELVGATAFVSADHPTAFLPDTLWLLRAKDQNKVSMRWLAYVLGSDSYRISLQCIASGTSNSMKKIQKGAFLKIKVCLPPISEQRKIADILTAWDEALEKLDALIAAKERRKKALMQQLLTGKRRAKGFDRSNGRTKRDRFGVYPADWRRVSLGDITREVSSRNAAGQKLPVLSCTKHHGLVLSEEYFGKRVYADDTSNYRVVANGEFAYATNHIEEGSIGYQNICAAGLVSPIYTVFKSTDEVDDAYLHRVLKSPLLVHLYRVNTSSSVDRRGSLRYDEFARIHIWLPEKEEQRAIANILDTGDEELRFLRAQRNAIDQQKRGLMQQLLTGEVRVKR